MKTFWKQSLPFEVNPIKDGRHWQLSLENKGCVSIQGLQPSKDQVEVDRVPGRPPRPEESELNLNLDGLASRLTPAYILSPSNRDDVQQKQK